MAETKEKAAKKATAKPRAAAGTKKTVAKEADGAAGRAKLVVYVPTHEEIAFLALQYWEQRGHAHGEHEQDWLRAEQQLRKMAS
ncbi:MAG TPA: DUF2934 domain-containing protein [Acidobacteriaceae bacterium]